DGGLGVIDLRAVNLALLGKWRWRLISGGVGLWRDIILARYGSLFPSPHLGGRLRGLKRASCWWRNVSLLGDPEDAILDWFDPWLVGALLRTQFQRLFQVSDQSASTVGEMGSWVEGQWVWDLRWRRDLFVWEFNLLESLQDILNHSTISAADDSWVWKHDPTGQYSVKSAFLALSRSTTDDVIFSVEEERLLPKVWKTWAPSKVAVFS
ncbi:putative ribonuclease H protein, partial [Trifolium medium]|nr:putative ribonuclease H protein [Trifolium medium]